jgi:hypothetical protein
LKKLLIATGMCTTMVASAATVDHYGFVKAGYIMADKVSGDAGLTAEKTNKVFYALNDSATSPEDEARSTISTTTTRWGMNLSNGSKTTGKIEFDLDNAHATGATSASNMRVRQAHLSYKAGENGQLTFGKKWTKFTGVNPFTYAHTRVSFFAGNNGFLVDGVDYTHTFGNTHVSLELTNSGVEDVNYVSGPVKTLNIAHKMGDHTFGLAHTMGDIKDKTIDDTKKDSAASGTKVYWNGKFGNTAAVFQYTTGANLGSIHTGGLAKAAAANDEEYKETGILLSAKHSMDSWSVFGSYGVSEYADAEEAGDGNVAKNTLISVGFDTTLDKGLVAYVEQQMFTTGYYVAADDEVKDGTGSALEVGMQYTF